MTHHPASAPVQGPTGTLQVVVEPQTSQVVVEIIDGSTREAICKIPAETVIEAAKSLDQTSGVFINQTA